jgi:hypothetical protein
MSGGQGKVFFDSRLATKMNQDEKEEETSTNAERHCG